MESISPEIQKATDLRKAMKTFRIRYGLEHTMGINDTVKTDYMSSEHTEPEAGGAISVRSNGPKTLLVNRKYWRSNDVSVLYANI